MKTSNHSLDGSIFFFGSRETSGDGRFSLASGMRQTEHILLDPEVMQQSEHNAWPHVSLSILWVRSVLEQAVRLIIHVSKAISDDA
jgi:hypothetical protein